MKLLTGWMVSAGLVLVAGAAHAQTLAPYPIAGPPYAAVSDIAGPYSGMPPEAPPPRYGGPILLPPEEVYTVVRENGFSPLGMPHLRGFVYAIAVVDRGGDDGRLLIDARNGRIIRFMPADRMGDNFNRDVVPTYGPGGPPPVSSFRGPPRPPGSVSHLASRSVPLPKSSPLHNGATPLAAKSAPEKSAAAPAQQSEAVQTRPADVPAAAAAVAEAKPAAAMAPVVGDAKPATPSIQPTQDMPKVQGLE